MNKKVFALAVCFSVVTLFSCQGQKGKSNVTLKNATDSVSYGLGVLIGQNMKRDGLDSLNFETLKIALQASAHGDTNLLLNNMQAQMKVQEFVENQKKAKGAANVERGKAFLEANKAKPGVTTLPDGLQYQVVKEGTGAMPTAADTVKAHYHGTTIDGKVFDSSVDRGEPVEFPLGQVIKGWTEGLQLMKVGAKYKFFIPADLAYGDRSPSPAIEANSVLVFDVELLEVKGK
ncbi:MAG: FKBP-type peptidyl-prolyl cis-trans isomerase [Bacteroidetes bacterium]|nr:FKBP-type peptidyl-prolyl cis-trans isomerase [Bacteroidota bacterium]